MRALIALSLVFGSVMGADFSFHSASSSMYVHSNDTLTLALSAARPNVLTGSPGSSVDLEFILTYNGYAANRIFLKQASEDNFMGTLDQTSISLISGQQQSVWVRRMIVPQRKNGMKVRFALTAELGNSRKRRENAPTGSNPPTWSGNNPGGSGYNPGGSVGGSSSNPGGSGYNPGGSGYNPGGSGYNPGGSGYNPGGSVGGSNSNPGGSGYNPGGSGYNPGGSVGGSNSNPGGSGYNPGGSGYNPGGSGYNPGGSGYNPGGSGFNPGSDWNYNDPSYKQAVTTTVEFTVTTEPEEDDSEPWTNVEYGADDEEDLCTYGPGDSNCDSQWWWAKFRVQDEESGLHVVKVVADGKDSYQNRVYYRYVNYPVGSNVEQEVIGAASCCVSGMKLMVTNVAGKTAESIAYWDGTGSGLSNTVIYAIIGGVVGVLVLVAIIVGVVCYRNKYSAVSQNP